MSTWLSLVIIVLVSVALFADLRRTGSEEHADFGGPEKLVHPTWEPPLPDDGRDLRQYGRPGSVRRSRSLRPAPRTGRNVAKRR